MSKINDEKTYNSSFYGIGNLGEDHGTCKIFFLITNKKARIKAFRFKKYSNIFNLGCAF